MGGSGGDEETDGHDDELRVTGYRAPPSTTEAAAVRSHDPRTGFSIFASANLSTSLYTLEPYESVKSRCLGCGALT